MSIQHFVHIRQRPKRTEWLSTELLKKHIDLLVKQTVYVFRTVLRHEGLEHPGKRETVLWDAVTGSVFHEYDFESGRKCSFHLLACRGVDVTSMTVNEATRTGLFRKLYQMVGANCLHRPNVVMVGRFWTPGDKNRVLENSSTLFFLVATGLEPVFSMAFCYDCASDSGTLIQA